MSDAAAPPVAENAPPDAPEALAMETPAEGAAPPPEGKPEGTTEAKPEPPALRLANEKTREMKAREGKLTSAEGKLAQERSSFEQERKQLAGRVERADTIDKLVKEGDLGKLFELLGVSPRDLAAALADPDGHRARRETGKTAEEIEALKKQLDDLKSGGAAATRAKDEADFLEELKPDAHPELSLYLKTNGAKAVITQAYRVVERFKKEGRKGDWTNAEVLAELEKGSKVYHETIRGGGKPPVKSAAGAAPQRGALTNATASATTGKGREMTEDERHQAAVNALAQAMKQAG